MTAKFQLGAFSCLMGLIIVSAYLGLIPTQWHDLPFYDSAGHFVLYGLWGYFFGKAFPKSIVNFGKFSLKTGTVISIAIATTEEAVQQFSPVRNFSFYDLAFGLAGIALSCLILNVTSPNESHFSVKK